MSDLGHRHNRVTYTDSATLAKVDTCSTCGHDFGPNQDDALVEKAARVIYEKTDWSGCDGSSWEHLRDREDYYPLARAVLAAVGPMIAAGALREVGHTWVREYGEFANKTGLGLVPYLFDRAARIVRGEG